MSQRRKVAAVAFVSAALAAGVGAMQGLARPSAAEIKVSLGDFTLRPSAKSAKAGQVAFVVRNVGKVDHELVILKTKRPAKKLYLASTGDVFELGRVGTTGPIDSGRFTTLRLKLKRGHYSLICNLPGHYRAGQLADFNVR